MHSPKNRGKKRTRREIYRKLGTVTMANIAEKINIRQLLRGHDKKVVVVLLLIIQVGLPLIITDGTAGFDGLQYMTYAENLLGLHRYTYDGNNPSCGRSPGYPVFLAAFLFLFGSVKLIYPVQLFMLFAAYLFLVLTYRNSLPGWWSIAPLFFLVACWPLHRLGTTLQTEALFIFLTSAAVFFLSRHLRGKCVSDLIAFSVLSTLSAYVRPITIFFVFFAAVFLFLFGRIRFRHTVIISAISVALLAPWTYRNWQVFGKFIPLASNYGSLYYMTDQEAFETIMLGSASAVHKLPAYREIVGTEFELDLSVNERYLERAKENISRDPVGFIGRCIFKTVFVWSYLPGTKGLLKNNPPMFYAGALLQLSFLAAACYGMALLRRRGPWCTWPLGLFAVYHITALFPFYAESRFLVPVYIILCGPFVYSIYRLNKYIRFRGAHRPHESVSG